MKDRIIVVEDEQDTKFILQRLLERNNFEVKIANNGVEALEMLKTYKPYVILADWTMPVMDGIELCKRVKANDDYKSIYYIMLTARSSLQDRVKGLDVGADDFLLKPIENQELLARIKSGIRIFKLQSELAKVEHSKALVEMACTIGHKFNNPLSSLILSLDSLKSELTPESLKKYDDDLEVIGDSINRIKLLVKELTKLEDPKTISYLNNQNMLNLGK